MYLVILLEEVVEPVIAEMYLIILLEEDTEPRLAEMCKPVVLERGYDAIASIVGNYPLWHIFLDRNVCASPS